MKIKHYFRKPAISEHEIKKLIHKSSNSKIQSIESEYCFNVEVEKDTTETEEQTLVWLLSETFEPQNFSCHASFLKTQSQNDVIVEVGPRMNFTTTYSSNAVSICRSCNIESVQRIERSKRFLIHSSEALTPLEIGKFVEMIHDRMTECIYKEAIQSFKNDMLSESTLQQQQQVKTIPVLEQGRAALEQINKDMGLAFDEADLNLYTDLFKNHLKRNPTEVECFDIGQSNSEHSRHWFFNGNLVIDGEKQDKTLFQIVKNTLKVNVGNSLIAFCDNSSAIKGFDTKVLVPSSATGPSKFIESERNQPILFTAETHNFPSGVAPFPGAETGTGGRIRDTHATGRGSLVVAGTVGYSVGQLLIPGYNLPWETKDYGYPDNLATPLKIEIEASNGASDYGNKFGEPVIIGFTRSYGQTLPNGERREYIKPIMFSGGIGFMDERHLKKDQPELGMTIVKAGGPAFRIGMGGGSASSMVGGDNKSELDFSAVQRGDAEMGQKLNRIIRACVEVDMNKESNQKNPIVSVHDQGAGGAGNVCKEIVDPLGAKIYLDRFHLGDKTLTPMEIWGAEYQEQDALLIKDQDKEFLQKVSKRERLPIAFVGEVSGDGQAQLIGNQGQLYVDLPLEKVLQKMPPKTFNMSRKQKKLLPFCLPKELEQSDVEDIVKESLSRVLRLLSVGSKRFLINKVDRAVTGLVARQQCVGPLHTPLSNVAVIASSYFEKTGAATSIGEQPIKGFISAKSMAYLTVGEAMTNLVWASITDIKDIKCSGNWMWAAKLEGEGSELYDAAVEMHDTMVQIGIAIDGGKDSLSMAAKAPNGEVVKAPGTLVVSTYVSCDDITKTITPDLKLSSQQDSVLIYIDLGCGNNFLGGSALTQVFNQIGDGQPHRDTNLLVRVFQAVQQLVKEELITAGHDRSDGGLITTLIEMSISGNRGCVIDLQSGNNSDRMNIIKLLFNEELGMVIELKKENLEKVKTILSNLPYHVIGYTHIGTDEDRFQLSVNGKLIVNQTLEELTKQWEETSYQLELIQVPNPNSVNSEFNQVLKRSKKGKGLGPTYTLTYTDLSNEIKLLTQQSRPKVVILREEGSNGDREMAGAFYFAGFEPWDVTMSDLIQGHVDISQSQFKGIAFVGGFSYADVMDSSKGWAGSIKFHQAVAKQFEQFYMRPDTFSLGLCNGCQLMALLGWVPWRDIPQVNQPRFIHNKSGKFESRWVTLRVMPSPAILLKGMEGSVLGCWSQHGEGQAFFQDQQILDQCKQLQLAPIRYVDDESQITETYPLNPSGTPEGIAGLCSKDGRHLALMPHPERSFLQWQWPWTPQNIKSQWSGVNNTSPWIRIFQNARIFVGDSK
ncbi:phosphoribosylformylglycinamide synthase [Tieghemostelium lacteum]|uniref:phosphoribosylformylglycinamidine synthase n=1 Tax=Tieghemostelium lacteum TaxID=361077 RepID=A0A151ZI66_TIELA|nr:phosphoribosylformylglycinamide synthase [Tieghemostelium lacteum]|eukprot:KYQ93691.1 phosphoribosylformylglycinamide synthase [Tieghemostelium lacteum]